MLFKVNDCDMFGQIRAQRRSDDSEYCLTVGDKGLFQHSLWLFELNLVWQSVDDQDVYCPNFCKHNQQISTQYMDKDYSLQWDGNLGGGNEIESDERNAKIGRFLGIGDGRDFVYETEFHFDGICADVDGDNEWDCCLEIDDDQYTGYKRDGDTFTGYEAKFDCKEGRNHFVDPLSFVASPY